MEKMVMLAVSSSAEIYRMCKFMQKRSFLIPLHSFFEQIIIKDDQVLLWIEITYSSILVRGSKDYSRKKELDICSS